MYVSVRCLLRPTKIIDIEDIQLIIPLITQDQWRKLRKEDTNFSTMDNGEVIESLTTIAAFFKLGTCEDLRQVLRTSSAVISGSSALSRLCSNNIIPGDLDLYVSRFDNFEVLRHFLALNEYASVVNAPNTDNLYPGSMISSMETFHHHHSGKTVQVIYSTNHSALAPVLEFDTTLLMNFINADNIVCLYPDLTMNEIGE